MSKCSNPGKIACRSRKSRPEVENRAYSQPTVEGWIGTTPGRGRRLRSGRRDRADAARGDQLRHPQIEVGRARRGVLGEHPRRRAPLRAARRRRCRRSARARRAGRAPSRRGRRTGASARARSAGGAAAATFSAASVRAVADAAVLRAACGSSRAAGRWRARRRGPGRRRSPGRCRRRPGRSPPARARRPRRAGRAGSRAGRAGAATEENGSTASSSASRSRCSVLWPRPASASAARTCADSEEPLPVIETRSTAAKEESRNHSQPSAQPGQGEEHAGEQAPGQPVQAGHRCPIRRRAAGSYPHEGAAERVDVAGAEREDEVAGRAARRAAAPRPARASAATRRACRPPRRPRPARRAAR